MYLSTLQAADTHGSTARCAEVRASTWAVQNARTSGAVSGLALERDGPALMLSQKARALVRLRVFSYCVWVWPYSDRSPPRSRRTLCQGGFGESWSPTGRKCGKTFLWWSKKARRTCTCTICLSCGFSGIQHCKASPKLPVLPTKPAGSLPSAETAGTGVDWWTGGLQSLARN